MSYKANGNYIETIEHFISRDSNNDKSWKCNDGQTFALYDATTLTPAQKEKAQELYAGNPESYYAAVQGSASKGSGCTVLSEDGVMKDVVDVASTNLDLNNLLFTANGNVGIGTSNPQKKLDVDGDIKVKKICFSNQDNTDETCIDYSIALLTTEMLRNIMPENINDLTQLSTMNLDDIGGVIKQINDAETPN